MTFLTAAFSFGRVISSTVFGVLSDSYDFQTVYYASILISFFGNMMYAASDKSALGSKWVLLASRFVVGFGAGCRSVCRANVAALTTTAQRLRYLAIIAGTIFVGYAVTPGLGAWLSFINVEVAGYHLSAYTSPGIVLAFCNVLSLVGLCCVYDPTIAKEDGPQDALSPHPQNKVSVSNLHRMQELRQQHSQSTGGFCRCLRGVSAARWSTSPQWLVWIGIWVFIGLNFTCRGILAVFETIATKEFLQTINEPFTSEAAVYKASIFHFGMGLAGVFVFFSMGRLCRTYAELSLLVCGFVITGIGAVVLAPRSSNAAEPISLDRFVFGYALVWSIGLPLTGVLVVAAFSKILGAEPQGAMMGYIGSAGALGRIILPIALGATSSISAALGAVGALCFICCAAVLAYYFLVQDAQARASAVGDAEGEHGRAMHSNYASLN
jgi:ceroid-lipofuscinosis MFS transporter 7